MIRRCIVLTAALVLISACGRNSPSANEAAQPLAPSSGQATAATNNLPPPTAPGPGAPAKGNGNEPQHPLTGHEEDRGHTPAPGGNDVPPPPAPPR